MQKKSIALVERAAPATVQAPHLSAVVKALFAVKADPLDRRARITLALLQKQGATSCPCCGVALSLVGYTKTETAFHAREAIACRSCGTSFVVGERQVC
jgi:hypothetical protein